MNKLAKGSFEVNVAPVENTAGSVASGRLSIDKRFSGELAGTSRGEMWTADTKTEGSAGYVAIERIEGTLEGRRGAFVVLHQGTMRAGGHFRLSIVIVPDSGTDALSGIAGTMKIIIGPGGEHNYELEYTL
jgi:hypothetical protein